MLATSVLFLRRRLGVKMGSCVFEKENVFFWMLPFHRVVQPDLEMQQKGGLCDTGVPSVTLEENLPEFD